MTSPRSRGQQARDYATDQTEQGDRVARGRNAEEVRATGGRSGAPREIRRRTNRDLPAEHRRH